MRASQLNHITENDIQKQLEKLKAASEKSKNPCLKAVSIALADKGVESLIINKYNDGYVYKGVSCLTGPHIPENEFVLFDFDCKPGTICLVKPWFLVTVDIINSQVLHIEDPYLPTIYTTESAISST